MTSKNINTLDSPADFERLTQEEQKVLMDWIADNVRPLRCFNNKHNSYGLKHRFKAFYITNGQMKGAMLKSGYRVKDVTEQNWIFNISQSSPCYKMKKPL